MPAMMVWPVSSLYSERNDGSSRRMVTRASVSFFLSSAVFGSIDIEITGLRPGEKMHEELTISSDHRHTAHAKIFSAREERLSEIEVARTLRALREALAAHDIDAARVAIEAAVQEYTPNQDRNLS